MSLITYIEPINVGSALIGVGALVITFVCAWILFSFFKPVIEWIKLIYNRESKYELLEEKMLDEVAKKKGVDLDAEMIKRNVLKQQRKSFRKKVEEEIYDKLFPEKENN